MSNLTSPQFSRLSVAHAALCLSLFLIPDSNAFPIGRTTFKDAAPFAGTNGVHSLTAINMDSLLTVAAWADTSATASANLYQWWWIFGVDSGIGNGALLDGAESMTLTFDKSAGAAMIYFLYTGGTGGANNLARISISGFSADPGASAVTWASPRISNLSYSSGTLTFDYLNDGAGDYGQLMLANSAASAGRTLIITGAISPNGDATGWGAALFQVDVQEAYAAPAVLTTSIPHNSTTTYVTTDGSVTIKGYSDRTATTPANLGRYQDECFGVYGGPGGNVVDTNESLTIQFANGVGLARLDTVYSSGEVSISGFTSDPGLVDPSGGTSGSSYAGGVLTFTMANGGFHPFYFTNRLASIGQTLRITVAINPGNQFSIARIGLANSHTLIGPDITSNVAATHTTADGLLALTGYVDTPGTVPANLYENIDWFGVSGGANNEAIEGAESLNLQFAPGAGLSALGTRYTSGQVIISGFVGDPGFTDASGIATGLNYSSGTLSYTFNSPRSPEVLVNFTNLSASAGQTLSVHTDGNPGSQIALTRIEYSSSAPVVLTINKSGSDVVLAWPSGTLQQSETVNGTYDDVTGVTSPYTNAASGTQKFFRIKVQ